MDPKLKKKEKILNYSIVTSCIVLLVLVAFIFSGDGLDSIMGNSVYNASDKYEIGQLVEYANTNWYIISENSKSYTLLREKSLTSQDINNLNLGISVGANGEVAYDYSLDCNENSTNGCSVSLENSLIGKILTAYQNTSLNINDLITVDDYTIRLINSNDINSLKNNNWLYLNQYYWTMSTPNYSNLNVFGLYPSGETYIHMVYDGTNDMPGGLVRPVINLKKAEMK